MSVIPTALRKICPTCSAMYSYDEAHSCTEGNSKLLIDDLPAVDPESLIGATLGERYHIEGFLEGGGMGAVLRATHVTLLRPVAIKILVMREYQDTAAQQRFFQEAILASRIRHPNVIDIYDFGVLEGGHLYLVMEFLEGRTLRLALRDGPLPALRACLIGCQIARGLQAVHEEGIVHRDLKPDNIFLLQRDGHPDFVKIVDFGIAKARGGPNLTQSGMLLGTPLYMAPEQIGATQSDHRVDQYSLGCVLYRMLTASLPFDSPDTAELLSMHVRAPVHPPRERRPDLSIPASLEAVVLRLLAKKPEDRFPTMREVAEALACEIERLQDRGESTRLQVVSAVSAVMPKVSGMMPTISGVMPAVPAMATVSGPMQRVSGSMAVVPFETSSQTRLLPAPVHPERAGWRRLVVPAALGVGGAGVILFLLVALGNRPPQALTIEPVQASRYTPPPVSPPAPPPDAALAAAAPPAAAPAPLQSLPGLSPEDAPDLGGAPDLGPAADLRAALVARAGHEDRPAPAAKATTSAPAPAAAPSATSTAAPRRPPELTVRFEIRNRGVTALLTCPGRPPVRCEGQCVVPLPEGGGDCVASAPGSGFRAESFPVSALRALPRDGKGPPAQAVTLRYIRP